MFVKQILTPLISQELEKYQRPGRKIKLKSTGKRRIKYSIICGALALLGFAHPVFLVIAVIIYIILMMKTKNNVNTIISLAKKSPDKPIEQIIAEEVKL